MDKVKKTISKDFSVLPKLASLIEETYAAFGIITKVVEVNHNSKNLEFCLEMALGNSIEEIIRHQKDIAMALASPTGDIEIEAPIPGRSLIAIRVPYTEEWLESQKKSYKDISEISSKNNKIDDEKPLSARQVFATFFYLIATGFGKIGNLIDHKK